MKRKHNFPGSKRAAAARARPSKTRITIRLDDDVLGWFREQARAAGGRGYQKLINRALRDYIEREPLERTLRRVLREELARADRHPSPHAYGYEQKPAAWVADAQGEGAEYGASLKRGSRRRRTPKE